MIIFLKILMYSVEIIAAILLVGIILIQKSKDEGLGVAFGAQMGESLFGSRTGNVLTRITVILAVVFLLNTLILGIVVTKSGSRAGGSGSLLDRAAPTVPVNPPAQSLPIGAGAEMPAPTVPAAAPDAGAVAMPSVPAAAPAAPVAPAPAPAKP